MLRTRKIPVWVSFAAQAYPNIHSSLEVRIQSELDDMNKAVSPEFTQSSDIVPEGKMFTEFISMDPEDEMDFNELNLEDFC